MKKMKKVFNNSEVNDTNSSNGNVAPSTSTPETVFPKWIDDKSIDAGEYTCPKIPIITEL